MAKVVITFEDGTDDEQLIYYSSDRDVDLNELDPDKMTAAEQLATIAIQLLDEYMEKEGIEVDKFGPRRKPEGLN